MTTEATQYKTLGGSPSAAEEDIIKALHSHMEITRCPSLYTRYQERRRASARERRPCTHGEEFYNLNPRGARLARYELYKDRALARDRKRRARAKGRSFWV